MTKQRILVVADDTSLRATLARWLIAKGYSIEIAGSAKYAREVLANEKIGVAILAPERLGGDFARELRAAVERLIVVVASAADSTSLDGMVLRADGYLDMPLDEQDVLARVAAASMTASELVETAPEVMRFAGYTLDARRWRCVDVRGSTVALTRAEFSLLLSLVRGARRVVSRDELTRVVAGRAAEPGDRSVDVLISRLRRKIEPDPKSPQMILTVPGVGYVFAQTSQDDPRADGSAAITAAEASATSTTAARVAGARESAATASASPLPRSPTRAEASARIAQLAMQLSRALRPRGPRRPLYHAGSGHCAPDTR